MPHDVRAIGSRSNTFLIYGLFLSVLCFCIAPFAYAQKAKTYSKAKEAAIKREAITVLSVETDKNIALKRFFCATHEMGNVKARIEGNGTPFPDVAEYCHEVLKEAGKRGTLPQMYGLIAPLGKMEPWEKIFDAANRNQSSYLSVSGKKEPITCPLGFDAGYAGGYNQPDRTSRFNHISDVRIKKMTVACFDPKIEIMTLTVEGKPATSAYVGFMAGYLKGQADAKLARAAK